MRNESIIRRGALRRGSYRRYECAEVAGKMCRNNHIEIERLVRQGINRKIAVRFCERYGKG